MSIPTKAYCDGMHKEQLALHKAFDQQKYIFYVLEWARRHRKTTTALNILIREACRIKRAKFLYIAPTQVQARGIVWDDPNMLRAYLPDQKEMGWVLNEQQMMVKFANGSILKICGSDNPEALRGFDFLGLAIDEWAMVKPEVWLEILRPIMTGTLQPHLQQYKRWAMFIYTPKGINHATRMMDKACCLYDGGSLPDTGEAEKMLKGWYASRLDAEKAGIVPMANLLMAKDDMPKVLYDQEMRCSRVTSEEMTLITSEMLNDLNSIAWDYMRPSEDAATRKIVSCDPAFGGDVCKIKGFNEAQIVYSTSIIDKRNTQGVVVAVKMACSEVGTKNIIVDCIGEGKGVGDLLIADDAGYNVQVFKSSHKPSEDNSSNRNIQYANKRAEAYAYAAEEIRLKGVEPIQDPELIRQLTIASRYKLNNSGKLIIQPKDVIRKDLGCSPDDADTYIMGRWGLQYVEPESSAVRGNMANAGVSVPSFIRTF